MKFRVEVRHELNDLHGSVEVISTNEIAAKMLVRRQFFRSHEWRMVKVTQLRRKFHSEEERRQARREKWRLDKRRRRALGKSG